MNKLIHANLSRIKNDTFFWLATIGALPAASVLMLYFYFFYLSKPATDFFGTPKTFYFDKYYFAAILALPLLSAVIITLFVGKDFTEKTVRNKLISGQSRTGIYLSNLIIGFSGTLLIYAAMLLGGLIGIPLAEPTLLSGNVNVLTYIFIGFFAALSCTSVSTLINMALGNRIASLIISLVLFFGILSLLVPNANLLALPQFYDDHHFVDGVMTTFPNALVNEQYVSGTERVVRECIMEIFPSGNMLMLYKGIVADPIREIILSLFFTAVTSAGGIYLFKRKDLK